MHKVWDPFLEQADRAVVEMWRVGRWAEFCRMLPTYNDRCFGEGDMHDIAMLLGALGWDGNEAGVEIATPCFGSSGSRQINAIFPVTPLG
jgi:3,4-dihydroxyphenylacetate 2,3-dioxygenase